MGRWLADAGYEFVTPTPATIARVNRRPEHRCAGDLRGVFGWNRPFRPSLLAPPLARALRAADAVDEVGADSEGPLWRTRVRVSSVGRALYLHSAYPTDRTDAVFFGPDSYRFVRLIEQALAAGRPPARILDLGCGSGVGGLEAARCRRPDAAGAPQLVLADINPAALSLARVNAALAGQPAEIVQSDLGAAVAGAFDLIIANPPYMLDSDGRTYRDGGGPDGTGLARRIVAEAVPRLSVGGRLVLYTGVGIEDGTDRFRAAIEPVLSRPGLAADYQMIDPDVFGEELELPSYRRFERIAVVGLSILRTHS